MEHVKKNQETVTMTLKTDRKFRISNARFLAINP